jgi:hypothetical protein
MQLDIGFGDAVTPPAVETAFPAILDGPADVLLAYPTETQRSLRRWRPLANNLAYPTLWAHPLSLQHSLLACDSFQLLLLLIVFGATGHILAGLGALVAYVLLIARILCIYSGSYLYSFPK